METKEYIPRLVVLELTHRCVLKCIHCRASSRPDGYDGELAEEECFRILDDIASFSKPIIILSGGEALLREDIFDIIRYANKIGLTPVLATCGVTLTEDKARKLKASRIKRVSVSIDGKDARTHDFIRQEDGVFDKAIYSLRLLKSHDIEFQVNTTVTRHNLDQLKDILRLAEELGARSFHPFFLVPVGRASNLKDGAILPHEYERALNWIYNESRGSSISIKPTCAPHYSRILIRKSFKGCQIGMDALRGGCLGGKSFAFISSGGKVQICGFLALEAGDVRRDDFQTIWKKSAIFNRVRDLTGYKGKCGECEYIDSCGGCRARAYATSGDYLEEEPDCVYQPIRLRSGLIVSDHSITDG